MNIKFSSPNPSFGFLIGHPEEIQALFDSCQALRQNLQQTIEHLGNRLHQLTTENGSLTEIGKAQRALNGAIRQFHQNLTFLGELHILLHPEHRPSSRSLEQFARNYHQSRETPQQAPDTSPPQTTTPDPQPPDPADSQIITPQENTPNDPNLFTEPPAKTLTPTSRQELNAQIDRQLTLIEAQLQTALKANKNPQHPPGS